MNDWWKTGRMIVWATDTLAHAVVSWNATGRFRYDVWNGDGAWCEGQNGFLTPDDAIRAAFPAVIAADQHA